jgi:pyrroloquinoline quinone biosynthesis protein D
VIPKPDSECLEEVLEGEIVLYSSGMSKAVYLNESAALIWQLIDGKRSVDEMISLLIDAYPEVPNLKDDVMGILETLRAQRLVHF